VFYLFLPQIQDYACYKTDKTPQESTLFQVYHQVEHKTKKVTRKLLYRPKNNTHKVDQKNDSPVYQWF
jgi:hypothetical protein